VRELALETRIEVISADSRQIYRMMDIGTAKPSPVELAELPHHLVDVVDPDGSFSAGAFAREARSLILGIRARGAVPIVVGGTGLYIQALTGPFDDLPVADGPLRAVLAACEAASSGFTRRFLLKLDPVTASSLNPGDAVRILRALEISILSGRRASELRTGRGNPGGGEFRTVRMELPADELRSRIESRTMRMFEAGLRSEVLSLLALGYGRSGAMGRTIGYKEILDSFDSGMSEEETASTVARNTWRFARKQRNMLGRLPARLVTDGLDPDAVRTAIF
jgi:tRNA dimethylallyltransferase